MSSASSSARAPSAVAKVEATVDKVETQLLAVEQKLERGQVDLNDTPARYAGYGARLRTLVLGYNRYLAYASDAGEGFRPVVSPLFVRATYGISWSYLLGDVAYEGYKSSLLAEEFGVEGKGAVVGLTVAKRALFQGTASMLLPAFTIHSIVKYSAKAIKRSSIQSARARLWLPTLLGTSSLCFGRSLKRRRTLGRPGTAVHV